MKKKQLIDDLLQFAESRNRSQVNSKELDYIKVLDAAEKTLSYSKIFTTKGWSQVCDFFEKDIGIIYSAWIKDECLLIRYTDSQLGVMGKKVRFDGKVGLRKELERFYLSLEPVNE